MPVRGSPGTEDTRRNFDQQRGCSLLWRVAPAFTPYSEPSPQFDFRPSKKRVLLFDLPLGLVVDDKGRAAADRVVKLHDSVGSLSRYTQ